MADHVVTIKTGENGPSFTIELRMLNGRYVATVKVGAAPGMGYQFQGGTERQAKGMAEAFIYDMREAHWKSLAAKEARRAGRIRQNLGHQEEI